MKTSQFATSYTCSVSSRGFTVQFGSNFKVLCQDIQLVFGMEDCLKVNDIICGGCCMVLFLGWMLLTGFLKTFVQVPVLKAPTMLDKRVRICYNF